MSSEPGFRFVVPITVQFRDTDAMGHVNNAVYFTYLEVARSAYWFHVVGGSTERDLGFILARAECDFRAAAKFGDKLEVRVRVPNMGKSSFTMEYEIIETASGRVIATGKTVQVSFDYASNKAQPLPDATRAAIEAFEGS